MPITYRVKMMSEEPILVVKYLYPALETELMFEYITGEVVGLMGEIVPQIVYRINDFTSLNKRDIYQSVTNAMAYELQGKPGTTTDPRLIPVFVGNSEDVRRIVDEFNAEFEGYPAPLFTTRSEALEYIRAELVEVVAA